MCNYYNNQRKLCANTVVSTAVSVVTVDGVPTLVIDTPAASYRNGDCIELIVAQAIPETATVDMPVALGIGGVTDPVYPLVRCNCTQVTARAIQTRGIYGLTVRTTPTGANLVVRSGLYCAPTNNLVSIPVAAAATPAP